MEDLLQRELSKLLKKQRRNDKKILETRAMINELAKFKKIYNENE